TGTDEPNRPQHSCPRDRLETSISWSSGDVFTDRRRIRDFRHLYRRLFVLQRQELERSNACHSSCPCLFHHLLTVEQLDHSCSRQGVGSRRYSSVPALVSA